MRRAFVLFLAGVVLVTLAACGESNGALGPATDIPASDPTPTPVKQVQVRIGSLVVEAETAISAEERGQGLGGRPLLAENAGMLFFMTEERIPGFHMRGMLFPLDFIWISADGFVADVTENVPHPAAAGETLSGISPSVPILYVLEVNAGVVAEAGIAIGDEVTFEPDIT